MTTWDYAQMTHDAASNGGPAEYLNAIRTEGLIDGRIEGAIGATIVIAAVGGIAKLVVNKIRSSKQRALEAKAKITEMLKDQDDSDENQEAEETDEYLD